MVDVVNARPKRDVSATWLLMTRLVPLCGRQWETLSLLLGTTVNDARAQRMALVEKRAGDVGARTSHDGHRVYVGLQR